MAVKCFCQRTVSSSLDDLRSGYFWLALVAELLGTALLVLVGCGSCLGGSVVPDPTAGSSEELDILTPRSSASWEKSEPTKLQISLAFGLAVSTSVWVFAHVSGGHINPAVTLAMLCARRISIVRAVLYILAQCIGAVIGAGLLAALTPVSLRSGLGSTSIDPLLTKQQGFGIEASITFVLVLTVFACCDTKRTDLNGSAPLTIGLAVTLCHLFAVSFSFILPIFYCTLLVSFNIDSSVLCNTFKMFIVRTVVWIGKIYIYGNDSEDCGV